MTNFLEPGTRVRYVPLHADGDHNHPDCEMGTIRSLSQSNENTVFVVFDKDVASVGLDAAAKACDRFDLHAVMGRQLDNNLITSHGNHILIFDLDPPGVAEVEYVCNVDLGNDGCNPQYLCKGAHSGGPISLIVVGIDREWDTDSWHVDYKKILWADDRTECTDSLVLDCYFDQLIRDDCRQIIIDTWD